MPPKTTVEMKGNPFYGCDHVSFTENISIQASRQDSLVNTQNVDLDDDEDNGNILLDKELTNTETVEIPQEVATEMDGTVEPSPTTATTTNTNIPNTGAQNNGLLAVILTILGGALGLISKKHRENN